MKRSAWTRRLDDHVDGALKRRFGVGLLGGDELSLRKHMAIAVIGTLLLVGVIFLALLAAGEPERGWTLIGPVLGAPLGVLIGHLIRDARRRR